MHDNSHFTYKFTYTQEEIRNAQLWISFVYFKLYLIYIFILFFFLYDVLTGQVQKYSSWIVALMLALFFIYSLFFKSKQVIKKNPILLKEMEYKLTEKGLESSSATWTSSINWESIPKVVETKSFFYIFVNNHCAKFIPKRVIPSEALQHLREFVKGKTKYEQRFKTNT